MKTFRISFLIILLIIAISVSLLAGRYSLAFSDIADICFGGCNDSMKTAVFLRIRLPRTLVALVAGAALSLAGWLYQNVFMNTLVSPDVLGVSGGCSVGAITAILAGASATAIQLASFSAGIIAVILTLLLARATGRHGSISMLLAGIVMGALANSCIMLMKYIADPHNELAAIEYWLMGSFHSAGWQELLSMLPVFLPCAAIIFVFAQPVRMLAYGDDEARAMGIPAAAIKYVALISATGMVASVVSVAGSISWLGLIVPHFCRIAGGEGSSTPYEVCLCGSMLTLFADVMARTLTTGEIPISIITSFMGAVFLAIILVLRAFRTGRAAE